MDFERRRAERLAFDMRECLGMLVLETSDEEYEIETIIDISLTGIGLELPAYLEPETRVRLGYEEAGISVGIDGVVVWCDGDPEVPELLRLGVRFDEASVDAGSRFLHALCRYTVSDGRLRA